MTDTLAKLFARCSADMAKRGLARFAECGSASARRIPQSSVDPVGCLMAAAAAGLLPGRQPPGDLSDDAARTRDLLLHLERGEFRVRTARSADLPALVSLEERCWAKPLRTPKSVLTRRIARYPEGQLVLLVDDAVAGAIYSQRIGSADALDGVTAARADTLHDPAAKTVQLLAVNILPEMQQRNLGDRLLEFMLIYRSLQADVEAVVAVTLCRGLDHARGVAIEDYIRQRNKHGVLADPILRFHELHGAVIERVVPGYRPGDVKNGGNGVLVRYDIRHRRRDDVRVDAAPEKIVRASRPQIRSDVRDAVRACLGEEHEAAFAFDRPLMEMGLDSAGLLALREALARRYRLPLTAAFFFQYNTAKKIAGYLGDHVAPAALPDKKRSKSSSRARGRRDNGRADQGIAIVGMACRLPGGIDTPAALWACLRDGTSAIGGLPDGRWQWPGGIDPARSHKGIDRGGFLDDVAGFDAPFFRVSPAEAESMDPQQRVLLELCWQAVEHAGHAPDSLAGSKTGVFIGASGSDYARLMDQSGRPAVAHYGTGSSMALLANRISYFYDFHGPSLVLDTACSASLVAVHEAVRAIRGGEASQALVGGINLILHPVNSIAYYKAGMLSRDGLCRTFDQKANGYVRSEGAVVLLLKPLQAALADRDRIHAVIKGTSCNHGGQAGGLTVPNPDQQSNLLRAAWQSADIDPRALGYIEAHGTGTKLGDPIEVRGIAQAFGVQAPETCGLGSVKTNLGHLEAAAGIAGLLKTVLCLQHRQLPPSLHFERLNEHIELSAGLHVVDRLQPWPPHEEGAPRLAGVSSFGSGGTNAHVVVAEYPSHDAAVVHAPGPVLFALSARTGRQLHDYARVYVDWLNGEEGRAVSLADLAYQLQAGRQAMKERLALVAADRLELIRKLLAFCAEPVREGAASNQLGELTQGNAGEAFLRALATQGDLDRIALLWSSGANVDWSLLHGEGERPLRLPAPTYPFAKHAYWLPDASPGEARIETAVAESAPMLLAPVWRLVESGANEPFPAPAARILVVGGLDAQREAVRAVYPAAQSFDIDPGVTIDALGRQLGSFGAIDHVIWLAPSSEAGDSLVERQEGGLLHVFKLAKALIARYGDRDLGWTVVTRRTQTVFGADASDPAHAGVHGFFGALAQEYPRWTVRLLDLDDGPDCPVREWAGLPARTDGEVLARRGGQWFRRVFGAVASLPEAPPAYRQGGVYVVIGGTGGVGEAWTRHVIERYRAQIVWIGRRPLDAAIQSKLDALAALGPAPVYIAADASKLESLQAAYETIKRTWPAIHGAIHSAVGAFDRAVADMDEQRFRDILSVKIDASVNMALVFGAEPLDFLLYFSSIVAVEKNGGLSGYAAGGAFADAFALHLRARHPVKIINWGHWDIGTATAIPEATKIRRQRGGYAPIRPDEAMDALQSLLTASMPQLALLKTARPDALPFVDVGRTLQVHTDAVPSCMERIAQVPEPPAGRVEALKPLSLFANAAMEVALSPLLAATLRSLGLLGGTRGDNNNVTGFYRRWLDASRTALAGNGAVDLDQAWRDWEAAKRGSLHHADLRAAVAVAETCLKALPDILSGRVRATDVIFPNSSMRLVEGVYRDNAVADHFNGVLADSLVAAVEARLRADPDARLRILEIGAGTGGTTASVLPRLAPYQRHIAEYAYTDLSKAFLFHAEEQFVGAYPYVRPMLFDVEKPLDGQAVEAGVYDVVLATNVLHATRDIRRTLANAKAALRKGGLLLLNEIGGASLFAHVTFGLLEGWWLSEDRALRIPDAPGLYPATWQAVLAQEGFSAVVFPAPASHALGQQVIVAESDGVVWQAAAQSARERPAAVAPIHAAVGTGQALKAAINQRLKTLVAKALRMDSGDVDVREPLEAYGIDSILTVQITDALRALFSDVRSTVLFEFQTIDALGDHFVLNNKHDVARLTGVVAPSEGAIAERTPARTAAEPPRGEAIAVIGMACRFPEADTVDAFWKILKSGRNCVREIPPDRWPLRDFFHADPDEAVAQGKSYSKWGAFLDGVTEFDPLFFNIAPKEAAAIDPQERLFLQTAWETLEDAGYTRERLEKDFGRQLGVFVGITRTGFDLFGPPLWQQGKTVYPHTSFSSVANRLSYFLNARGPSVPVDTMCSSSLTAIHQACQSLRGGECELAIAGGVNVYLHPSGYVGLSAARMLSPDGVCRSFGKGGSGFVPGEGVAAVMLKPLSNAIADKDRIYATIRATHVNHGGKTNGYTVPNPQAQADLVRDTLRKAGVDARAVSYVEAHGTGTELGDPIEVTGLTQAFQHFTPETGFCALGSVKSNIGHLEAAAGIAGFIKVVLQMRHGQLAPSLHAEELNPKIDFAKTPFVVQRSLAPWTRPAGGARVAGISSFGAGGANAHVVVEEYSEPARQPADDRIPCAIVLSAKNEERLRAYAGKLVDFIERRMEDSAPPALRDVAHTLQLGREAMDQRLAFAASSLGEVREKLKAYVAGGATGLHTGHAKQDKDLIATHADDSATQDRLATWVRQSELSRVLELWAKGLNVDWKRLNREFGQGKPIALPTYPFVATRYWLPLAEPEALPAVVTVEPPAPAEKPRIVKLSASALASSTFETRAELKPRALTPLENHAPSGAATPGDHGIALHDLGGGIYAIGPDLADAQPIPAESASAALTACVEWINAQAPFGAKVLLLNGLDRILARRAPSVHQAAASLADCAVPVIAVLTGENAHDAMLMSASCDVMICAEEGSYEIQPLSATTRLLFTERFGQTDAPGLVRGDALRSSGCVVVPSAEIEAYALSTARDIARASPVALAALKAHLSRSFKLAQTEAGFVPPAQGINAEKPRRVALSSEVVTLDAYTDGVVVVTLADRASKNTFSPAFVSGVLEAFAHIGKSRGYKAVVLTGYDHYFACGGTKEGLLAIQSGAARFTDEQSYAAPLACEIPVIAAMQGHGIGAGWAMGLFCDWAVYGEESVYQSPYMLYGFTPGAGSTLIFPHRLGHDLSREILLTAREFQGRELKQRGIEMPVLPRREVLAHALAMAHHLASSSREDLVWQKRQRSQSLRARLPETFAHELAMHDKTFVGNPDVVAGIARHFNEAGLKDDATPVAGGAVPSQMLETLRQSLADELQMRREDVHDEAAFIDMGMDSISAVTWVRKINRQFGLSLGATTIYAHPTLTRFAAFAAGQLGGREPVRTVGQAHDSAGPLLAWLTESLARELSIAAGALDGDVKFVDLGLDSVTAVTWIRAINQRYGLSIAATKVYSHPTLSEFHRYVSTLVNGQGGPARSEQANVEAAPHASEPREPVLVRSFSLEIPAPSPESVRLAPVAPALERRNARPAIAIIGMAGQFPKAGDVKQFWRNLVQGKECISDIPPARWSIDAYYDPDRNAPGKTVCKRMGVLDDIDLFDPLFFSISPFEAECMDPQQRLFLQNSWRCIEDAGYDPADLSGSLCGVFVGCAASDYSQLMAGQPVSAQGLIGESVAMLPARIAYVLNLQGPCLAIDTACSASLVALANACDSLVLGNSDLALAGGVYVINGPEIHVKMSKAGMLSPDGRCYSFDQRANGFVPGEGVGVLLLKRLEDAERDDDDIYGVIRGWGVNQDGKTNGITAPNQDSQTRLEAGVYKNFGIDPGDIQLIEAHGTGTRLGDPIEVEALRESFRQFTDRSQFCALGSVKSNIGHLATAAGVSGVIKAVLALQHRQLPPTINYRALNEHIDLAGSPFYVNTECRPWQAEAGRKRAAAVSSFGFSGTNSHMVLEEFVRPAESAGAERAPVLFPLSAQSREQLAQYAGAVGEYLADTDASLADIARTFQVGRPELSHRLAIVAATIGELAARLDRYASTGATDDYCFTGEADKKAGRAASRDLAELGKRWVAGETVDWILLSQGGRRRHGLPTYPFARERYWVPQAEAAGDVVEHPAPAEQPAQPVDPAQWRDHALAEGIDWQARLRHWLGKRVLVAYADEDERPAFQSLLTQLAQAGRLESSASVAYCRLDAVQTALAATNPDFVLILGGNGDASQAVQVSKDLSDMTMVVSVQAAAAEAAGLGDTIGGDGRLLVTQSGRTEPGAAMQRLFREWLAFDAADAPRAVHYAGERRLGRVEDAVPRSEQICLLRKEWRPKAPQPSERPLDRGTALILINHESWQVARELFEPSDFRKVVLAADTSVLPMEIRDSIDYSEAEAAKANAQTLLDRYGDITHIVDLTDLYAEPMDNGGDSTGKTALYQAFIAACDDLSIVHLTKELQPFRATQPTLSGARFAGLAKMLSADYRHVEARFVDIDQATYAAPQQLRRIVLQEFDAVLQETELCYREGQRFAPVLTAMEIDGAAAATRVPLKIAKDAVYVVSGGTNGVGLEMAKHLAMRGATKLVLMGITALPPKESWEQALGQGDLPSYVRNKLAELIALDKSVDHMEIYTGPLTDRHALRRYFMKVRATLGPVRGVIHAAATYSDAATPGFANKSLESMRAVWEPKADGLESLDAVFKADPLDFFVSFSSMTGLVPQLARGTSDYATANAFVDFFAAYQRAQSPTSRHRTIIWSDWNQTGAVTRVSRDKAASITNSFDRIGMRTFSNLEGRALFEAAMACDADDGVAIGYLDRSRFDPIAPRLLYANPDADTHSQAAPVRPAPDLKAVPGESILQHLEQWEVDKRAGRAVPVQAIMGVMGLDEIKRLDPSLIHRIHRLMFGAAEPKPASGETIDYAAVITATVMEVLKLKGLDPSRPFQDYGLDSISAMVLATRLEKKLKRELPPQWLIEFPTVEALSRHLAAQDESRHLTA